MKLKSTFLATTALLVAGNALAADVEVYGQVNKLVMGVDNGFDTNTAVVDNDTSSTRFGFKAQQQLENGIVVSGLLEIQSESNTSSSVKLEDDNANEEAGSSISERHSRIGLGTKYGTILLGKTSEATDGISFIDLGGVQSVMSDDFSLIGGSVEFAKKDGTGSSGVSVSDIYDAFDGGRTNLVRYDSPIINGVQASGSVSSGGDVALALRHSAEVGDLKIKSGIGYKAIETSSTDDYSVSGSASVLHKPTGLAASVSAGFKKHESSAFDDAEFLYTKLSYMPHNSNFEYAVDYAMSEDADTANQNAEFTSYGVATQYNIAEGVAASLMYRNFEADKLSTDVEDIQMMTAGLKIKF